MTIKNNIFEDLARISTSVATVAFESAKNVQDGLKSKARNFASSADLVSRDEFEAFKEMASKGRLDSEALLKEFAEFKQQIRSIKNTIDLLKGQNSKNSGVAETNPKIIEEIEKINSAFEKRINDLEDKIKLQTSHHPSKASEKKEGKKLQKSTSFRGTGRYKKP